MNAIVYNKQKGRIFLKNRDVERNRKPAGGENPQRAPKKRRGPGILLTLLFLAVIAGTLAAVYDIGYGQKLIPQMISSFQDKLTPSGSKEERDAERARNAVKSTIPMDPDSKSSFALFGRNIFQCTRDGARYYTQAETAKWTDTYTMTSPQLSSSGEYFAVTELQGRMARVYNTNGRLYEINTENPIISSIVNETACLGVITHSSGSYIVEIYDGSGTRRAQRFEQKDGIFPLSLAISPDGSMYAVSYLDTTDIEAVSRIVFYLLSYNEADYSDGMFSAVERPGEYIPMIGFLNNQTLAAISDSNIFSVSASGSPLWSIPLEGSASYAEISRSGFIAVAYDELYSNAGASKINCVDIYNSDGKLTGSYEAHGKITYLYSNERGIIVGSDRYFAALKENGGIMWEHNAYTDVYEILPLDNSNALYVTDREARIINMQDFRSGINSGGGDEDPQPESPPQDEATQEEAPE